jgi:tetratricopeptide (TPR) repeat protein
VSAARPEPASSSSGRAPSRSSSPGRTRIGALLSLVTIASSVAAGVAHPGPTAANTGSASLDVAAGTRTPAPAAASGSLAEALDALPIFVDDLPTAADHEATALYRQATFRNPDALGQLYVAAFASIDVGEAGAAALLELQALIEEDPEDLTESDAQPTIRAALAALGTDPRNVDRLGNAMLAAWLYGVLAAVDDNDAYSWHLQEAALAVLFEINRVHPGRRVTLLNLAFLTTVMPGLDFSGEPLAAAALALDPADVTARALLASIQSRRADAIDGAEQALATLAPLIADSGTAALGHALAGDAHLAASNVRRAEAPGSSRRDARLALNAYDHALGLAQDAGLHAGRARALERLGDLPAAAAAQAQALALAPGSLDFKVELARLRQRAGDDAGLREAAESAVVTVSAGWDPAVVGARFVTAPLDAALPDDRGFLGWSIGSDVDHLPVSPNPDTGAGSGVVVVETVPSEPPGIDLELASTLAPRAAWRLAFDAAILDGDSATASSLEATWNRVVPWRGDWEDHVDAASLGPASAGGGASASSTRIAETAFQRSARFDRATELCHILGDLACAGENEYLAKDAASALRDLTTAYEAALEDPDGPDPELRMQIAAAAEAMGDVRTAAAFLAETAGADDAGAWRAVAALRAGDLRLAEADPAGAVAWYDLALATIESNDLATSTDYHLDLTEALGFRALRQAARNNRAVALLRTLPADRNGTPRCDPGPARDLCETALAGIQAAVASDPGNAVYRMNEGWASRLLGKADEARAALQQAVELDSGLYPAFNDLGILLARDGDAPGARAAFTAALAADPGYDLARWNLGILALREGPTGIVEGERLLAEAIRRQPELRTAALDFRPDEEVYTFGFEAATPPMAAASPGRTYSIGAVVLAATASVAAIGQLASTLFSHGVQTAIGGTQGALERAGRHRRWRAFQRRLRQRLPSAARGWLAWSAVVVLLAVVTAWQAAQAAPTLTASAIVVAIGATLLALLAHEVGHLLAARSLRGRLIPAAWGPGAIVSLLFLPVQAATGPFLAERFRPRSGSRKGAWRFHLAGPVANALVAVIAYLLFLAEPAPALRLVAQIQLAAIGYTLLPVRPLDGWALKREQPRLLLAIGFGVLAAGTAFATGLL